jgi:hypothetical protein
VGEVSTALQCAVYSHFCRAHIAALRHGSTPERNAQRLETLHALIDLLCAASSVQSEALLAAKSRLTVLVFFVA